MVSWLVARMEQREPAVCWTLRRPHFDSQNVKVLVLETLIEGWPGVSSPQKAQNEVASCMSGLLARLDSRSVRILNYTPWQERLTLLEIQFAMRGPFGPCRSGSTWLMKTIASQEILASSCGNESVASRQLHPILTHGVTTSGHVGRITCRH